MSQAQIWHSLKILCKTPNVPLKNILYNRTEIYQNLHCGYCCKLVHQSTFMSTFTIFHFLLNFQSMTIAGLTNCSSLLKLHRLELNYDDSKNKLIYSEETKTVWRNLKIFKSDWNLLRNWRCWKIWQLRFVRARRLPLAKIGH